MTEPTSQLIDPHLNPTDDILTEAGRGRNIGTCVIRAGIVKRCGCNEQLATFIESVGPMPNIPCFDQWSFAT